jgi:hypothetical protein
MWSYALVPAEEVTLQDIADLCALSTRGSPSANSPRVRIPGSAGCE